MSDSGVLRFLGGGIRFAINAAASTYVGLRAAVSPATSFYLNLPTALPGVASALTVDASGNMGYSALSGGGSVTSVALSLPAAIFTVTGSPITTNGTLAATLVTQAANTVWAAPNGSTGAPAFRALVANDIPTITSAKISDFDTQVRLNRLDQLAVPTAAVAFNSQKITGLADGTNAQDAASWGQVQSLFNGTDNKTSVRVATTANITLSGTQTIDGVAVIAGDRVLVKNQTTASANGLYTVAAGAWTRTTDADLSAEVTSGLFTFVEEGTNNSSNGYTLVTPSPIVLGTTSLTFTQTSGAGQVIAGAGLTKTGNTLDIGGTTNRISIAADSVDIDANYAGQASITTLGTVDTGVWNATPIALTKGGTGGTDADTARAALVTPSFVRGTFTNTNISGGQLTITHSLGQATVLVQIFDNNGKLVIPDDITLTSTTVSTVDLTSWATLTDTWSYIVVG